MYYQYFHVLEKHPMTNDKSYLYNKTIIDLFYGQVVLYQIIKVIQYQYTYALEQIASNYFLYMTL